MSLEQDSSSNANAPSTSPAPSSSSESPLRLDANRTTSALEALVRYAGVGLFIVYLAGFIILSVYESSFGIANFNPFRTKIIAAGVVFWCLVALPVVAIYSDFGRPVPEVPERNLSFDELAQRNRRGTITLNLFIGTAIMLALLSSFLFIKDPGPPTSEFQGLFVIAAILLNVKANRVVSINFTTHPQKSVILSTLSTGVVIAGLYILDSGFLVLVALWFFFVSLSVVGVWASENKIRYLFNWRRWWIPLLLISFYTPGIYGRIEAKFGGGAPVPVTFCLGKGTVWIRSATFSASLIEETDQGFYILLPPNQKAFFIPRSSVISLYFDSREPHNSP